MKTEFYKLYIGQYQKEGTPATWIIHGVVPKNNLKNRIKEVVPSLKMGMELYIVTPRGEIKAYFRDGIDKVLK